MLCLILYYLLFLIASCKSLNTTEAENAGVKIRITQKGIDYLKNVSWNALNEEIANIKGIKALANFGKHGSIEVHDIEVTKWYGPTRTGVHLQPDILYLSWENATVSVSGEFIGRLGFIAIPGSLTGTAKGISAVMSVNLTRNGSDIIVKIGKCKTIVGDINFKPIPRGPLAVFVKGKLDVVNVAVRLYLPKVMCQYLEGFVENAGKDLMNYMRSFESRSILNSNAESLIKYVTDDLIFDNSLVADPVITPDYIELELKGEMRYKNSPDETPFSPPQLPTFNETDKMFYMIASSYVMNSLLYHAHKEDKLTVKFSEYDFPTEFRVRRLTKHLCQTQNGRRAKLSEDRNRNSTYFPFAKYCLGSLLPDAGKSGLNQTAEFYMVPIDTPTFKFVDRKGQIIGNGRILTYLTDGQKKNQLTSTTLKSKSNIKGYVRKNKILASLRLDEVILKLHRTGIRNLAPETVSELRPLLKAVVGPAISNTFKNGIPLPALDYVDYIMPRITIENDYAVIKSDISAKEEVVKSVVKSAIKGGISQIKS